MLREEDTVVGRLHREGGRGIHVKSKSITSVHHSLDQLGGVWFKNVGSTSSSAINHHNYIKRRGEGPGKRGGGDWTIV